MDNLYELDDDYEQDFYDALEEVHSGLRVWPPTEEEPEDDSPMGPGNPLIEE